MDNRTYERNGKPEIEFLWSQFEDLIEHGKSEDEKMKLELLERIYQFLATTLPKNNQEKKGRWFERLIHLYKICARSKLLFHSRISADSRTNKVDTLNGLRKRSCWRE